VVKRAASRPASDVWRALPGPQTAAYHSQADVTGYGGAAGGGKTDLLLGIAGTQHQRSILFRRVFPSLAAVIDRSKELFGQAGAYNEGQHRWRLSGRRTVEFASVQLETDLRKFQGQPHDLVAIDEATEFPERFVRFLSGWNRTTLPGQHCRIVMTFNPPTEESGKWVIRFFGPWVDRDHAHPARDGELRWYAMVDGEEREYLTRQDVPAGLEAKSRTFFHATLADNPYLADAGYGATIDSLPEPLRSILRGSFDAARQEDPWQVCPTAWVEAAQARWESAGQGNVPLSCIGVDVARGGKDQTVLALCYGSWFAPLQKYPGKSTPDGDSVAGLVIRANPGNASIHIDVIGVGASAYDSLRKTYPATRGVNFGEGTDARDKSGTLGFANVRAACFWRLREALDPASGMEIALPPDPELRSDLCALHWEPRGGRIVVESKEDIAERLHRSTDCGDAVALHFAPIKPSWIARAY